MFPDSTYLAGAPGTHPPRRRGLLTSAALVAIVVAVGIVVGSATTTASAASHGCADVMFIGARGSGEPLQVKKNGKLVTVFHGVGEPVDYMAGILGADVRAYGEHMRILPVIYSADSVDDLVPSKKEGAAMVAAGAGGAAAIYYERNLKPYMASIARGASQTVAEIHATLDGCPETEIVLGGYSQGAMAIHQAELQLERAHDEDSLDAIGGTLLLGDGDRTPNTQAKIFGGAPPGGEGVRTYLHGIKAADVVEPETTAEICVTGDIVCDFKLHVGPGSTSWYKNAAHTHSSYADLPQKVYLRKATEWIAEEMGLTSGPAARSAAASARRVKPPQRCHGLRVKGERVSVSQHRVSCRRARRIARRFLIEHRLPRHWEVQGAGDELNLHPRSSRPCCVSGPYVLVGNMPGDDCACARVQQHHCVGVHSGQLEGDDEYSDGAILSVSHIGCRHALRLVKPRYHHILRLEGDSGQPTGSFRVGAFHCRWELSGPVAIKRCVAGRRRFSFL